MTPRDFCFWLQGFFEIGGERVLTSRQRRIIGDHLRLVARYLSPDDISHAAMFCGWLSMAHETASADAIAAQLGSIFKHEIDPSFNDPDPKAAQSVHDGKKKDRPDTMRC